MIASVFYMYRPPPPTRGQNQEIQRSPTYTHPTDPTLEKGKKEISRECDDTMPPYQRQVLEKFRDGSYRLGSSSEGLT